MKVEYFIGIVPPEEQMRKIEHFQSRWVSFIGVEPHITLKAQGGLSPDEKWIDAVKKICADFKPFELSLENPMYFGENILYLSVHSNHLHNLHQKLVRAISPSNDLIKQYFELDDFVPHLTLGKMQNGTNISDGVTKQVLLEMEKAAKIELLPIPTFEVRFIRIYQLNIEKQKYDRYIDVFLNTGSVT